jgi:hypothetical protein
MVIGVLSVGLSVWLGIGISLLIGQAARAIDEETLLLLTDPLKPPDNVEQNSSIVTKNTISPSGLTIPSLWWVNDQFGSDLLQNWFAYSGTDGTPRRVDLLVNQQVWSGYNYIQRYSFLSHFGTTSRQFGYSTRVFNQRWELLAAYICDFGRGLPNSPDFSDATSAVPVCRVFLDPYGRGAFRGATSPFGGASSTNGGFGQ